MSEVTALLLRIGAGDTCAADSLLPLVYDRLRQMARQRMQHERPDHTLAPTALVHEAWLRVFDGPSQNLPAGRREFYSAFSLAMRRVLVDLARRKLSARRGGRLQRQQISELVDDTEQNTPELLLVHEALEELESIDKVAAELVNLHYFGGISLTDAAESLNLSRATAYRVWTFAKTFLRSRIESSPGQFHRS